MFRRLFLVAVLGATLVACDPSDVTFTPGVPTVSPGDPFPTDAMPTDAVPTDAVPTDAMPTQTP